MMWHQVQPTLWQDKYWDVYQENGEGRWRLSHQNGPKSTDETFDTAEAAMKYVAKFRGKA